MCQAEAVNAKKRKIERKERNTKYVLVAELDTWCMQQLEDRERLKSVNLTCFSYWNPEYLYRCIYAPNFQLAKLGLS